MTVRFARAPLGSEPTLAQVVAAIDGLAMPFVLSGRWGLPDGADPASRVVIAGAEPTRLGTAAEGALPGDPFAVLGDVPDLGGDAPAGTIGGGWVGWLGYDLGRDVERTLGPQPVRPRPLETARLAWYDDVLRRDEHGAWWVEALLPAGAGELGDPGLVAATERWRARLEVVTGVTDVARSVAGGALEREVAGPSGTARLGVMRPHRGAAAHRAAVSETVERIRAGELFQANVCLRLEGELEAEPDRASVTAGAADACEPSGIGAPRAAGLAARVLQTTDPWFGAWIGGAGDQAMISSSPELFLRRRGRDVRTGPIKGTAPRASQSTDPAADPAATALLESTKDRAEHVMIVDLMRNDLGRVCDYGSVRYEGTPRLEPQAGVWHLVSEVGGQLHDGLGDPQLLRATFPPGSVTGAPKVQAQRAIAAVEGTGREIYTGAHGLVSPVAGLELAVTIRTIELDGDQAWIGVGGGIVADSDPQAELDEALGKAAALVAAAGGTIDAGDDEAGLGGPGGPGPALVPSRRIGREAAGLAGLPWITSASHRPDPRAGLVETLLVDGGTVHRVDAHLARLYRSVQSLAYPPLRVSPDELAADVVAFAATAAPGTTRLRVLARPADTSTDIDLQLVPFVADPGVPIDLAPAVVPGGLGPHKWLDRSLVDTLTTQIGASPLLLDTDGTVLEAGWATVWWVDDGELHTPPLDGRILPGVARAALLAGLPSIGVAVREATAHLHRVAGAPLLLTSARGVSIGRLPTTPVAAVDEATELAARLAPLLSA
jgi:para-aminobenzoate synthetase/4-amino-4-deoxychorismate lyase